MAAAAAALGEDADLVAVASGATTLAAALTHEASLLGVDSRWMEALASGAEAAVAAAAAVHGEHQLALRSRSRSRNRNRERP